MKGSSKIKINQISDITCFYNIVHGSNSCNSNSQCIFLNHALIIQIVLYCHEVFETLIDGHVLVLMGLNVQKDQSMHVHFQILFNGNIRRLREIIVFQIRKRNCCNLSKLVCLKTWNSRSWWYDWRSMNHLEVNASFRTFH